MSHCMLCIYLRFGIKLTKKYRLHALQCILKKGDQHAPDSSPHRTYGSRVMNQAIEGLLQWITERLGERHTRVRAASDDRGGEAQLMEWLHLRIAKVCGRKLREIGGGGRLRETDTEVGEGCCM
ncbi:hypothetical protein XELAEV_18027067mg [Xenopus laevis]|uniref:Uncharacterized protein n=1 Tax=Xenopus laevis TaxID=8355 RepID=A0A974HJY5_XENLA|nr:hypothetical protein XELAEV_18027067mg [Xenopus laevis]